MSLADIGVTVLSIVFVVLVGAGAVPALVAAFHFLAIPFHAWINHYGKARPYAPRVAIVIPAWNEGLVIGATIDRLMQLDYPKDRLRICVVDDASTDQTPDVVRHRAEMHPGVVVHVRREKGGEGKAHTLNHGIRQLLQDDWMQALLIMDADVIYRHDALRKMTRHLADPEVGAVTAYVREGSARKNAVTRFIAFEYVLAQIASRRAQSVIGAVACLAGGAQLHTRENMVALGGAVDTTTLAEDTVTTFETQLRGRKVVFDPHAVVLAEEPGSLDALWKQRLRWGRGNVQLTIRSRRIWFRPSKEHGLGSIAFGLAWFSVFLLPALMIAASTGLIGLYLLDSDLAAIVFRALWIIVFCAYAFSMLFAAQMDGPIGRVAWREILLFPGIISLVVMITAFFPGLLEGVLLHAFGIEMTPTLRISIDLASYAWISLCMLAAWGVRSIDRTRARWLTTPLLYLVGFGPVLCAVTFAAYVAEARRLEQRWDKTEKTGRVAG